MHRISSRGLIAVALVVGMVGVLHAKGRTIRLVVTGSHLNGPIEVTDPQALVSVWTDADGCGISKGFIGAPTGEPAMALPRYHISFYVKPFGEAQEVRMMYVVRYAFDPNTSQGFVYLPGPGEDGYQVNASAITRRSDDGKWHYAYSGWSNAINSRLASVASGNGPAISTVSR